MVFDTNVLVYAVREEMEFHEACRRRIAEASITPASAYLTWNICYEFLRVTTHPRASSQPWSLDASRRFIAGLLASPGFRLLLPTERHSQMLAEIAAQLPELRGNLVHDLHTVVLMREHGVHQICTRDADFRRFPFLEVIDPADTRRA